MDDRINWKNSSQSKWIREVVQYRLIPDDAGVGLPDRDDEHKEMIQEVV